MRLRILLWEQCYKNCPDCCNQWQDLANLPTPTTEEFASAEEIILTGGEPLLRPNRLLAYIQGVRQFVGFEVPIYVYTAWVRNIRDALAVYREIDGMTLSLHNQEDVPFWIGFTYEIFRLDEIGDVFLKHKSMRLKVYPDVDPVKTFYDNEIVEKTRSVWGDIRLNEQWIDECPLPKGEIFRRAWSGDGSKYVIARGGDTQVWWN